MKPTRFIQMVAFLLIVISGSGLWAQDSSLDDQGHVNNPFTNPRANACYAGASLAGTCTTQAEWECGWAFIRFEYAIFPREMFTTPCALLLPELPVDVIEEEHHASAEFHASSPTSAPPNPDVTATATPVIEITPTVNDSCYYNWATQDLPDLGQRVKGQIEQAGFNNVGVRAHAYGENCIYFSTGAVKYFAAMETDFDITVPVADISDTNVLNGYRGEIQDILNAIPSGDLAGGKLGLITYKFVSPTGETREMSES
jgi:hypothetical protein